MDEKERTPQPIEEEAASFREKVSGNRAWGLFPYEGRFRSLDEIRELQRRLRERDRVVFVELIVLFLAMAALAALLWVVVRSRL